MTWPTSDVLDQHSIRSRLNGDAVITCTDPAVQDEDVTGTSEVNAVSIGAILGCRDKQPTDIHAVAVSESKMELGAVSNPQILYTHIDTILKDQTIRGLLSALVAVLHSASAYMIPPSVAIPVDFSTTC